MTLFNDAAASQFVPIRRRLAAMEAAWILDHALDPRLALDAGGDPERLIRESAYFKAQRRGFTPGHEVEDWLAAERELGRASRSSLLV